jgi:hypothetical protein
MGEILNAHKILVGKSAWKRSFGICGRRSEDNIKMDFKEIGSESVD